MSSNTRQLETRLARVERELADLKVKLARQEGTPWYRQIVGDFAGDKVYAEITRLGRRLRRGQRSG